MTSIFLGETFKPVSRDIFIDADLENEDILITSDSRLESGQRIKFFVFDQTSDVNIAAFWIEYRDDYYYHVGKCSEPGKTFKFPISPTTENDKIWRISESKGSLEISCNGLKVLQYEFKKGHQDQCTVQWSKDAARIKFPNDDTASKTYRISRKITYGEFKNHSDNVKFYIQSTTNLHFPH